MKQRRQLRVNDQRERLRKYLHTLRANLKRASREMNEVTRIRKGCPLERGLRYKRYDDAYEALRLGEKCLAELNHCYAQRVAGFRPGDHILVTIVLPGFNADPQR